MNAKLNTNLILVDGLPGSGKSTTAQLVWLQLVRSGYDASWFFEHQSSHPIYKYDDPENTFQTSVSESNRIHEEALHNWQRLADSLRETGRITILESTIFQTTIGWQQLIDWERSDILQYTWKVRRIIDDLNPCLIYLYQDDIAGSLRTICHERGQEFEQRLIRHISGTPYGRRTQICGLEGVASFYKTMREITDYLYSTWQTNKIAIETTGGDWQTYHAQIAKFLGTAGGNTTFSSPDSARFVGRYTEESSGYEITIAADEDGLYFDEPNKPRLYHRFDSTFCVQGMCVDFSFKDDETGAESGLECSGDLPNVGGFWIKKE